MNVGEGANTITNCLVGKGLFAGPFQGPVILLGGPTTYNIVPLRDRWRLAYIQITIKSEPKRNCIILVIDECFCQSDMAKGGKNVEAHCTTKHPGKQLKLFTVAALDTGHS